MPEPNLSFDVVVLGGGAAGLAAAVSAIEAVTEDHSGDLSVALLERAPKEHRGGNSYWSTAGFRLTDTSTLNEGFTQLFENVTKDAQAYVATLAENAPTTVKWVEQMGVDFQPSRIFLTSDDPRIAPVGGGAAIVDALNRRVDQASRGVFFGSKENPLSAGIEVLYETAGHRLILDDEGGIAGVEARNRDGKLMRIATKAVIIASGGFQGNPEMMARYIGYDVPTISLGGSYNRGEGIQMALDVGAKPAGQWNEFHPLPADPRTANRGRGTLTFIPIMETVPYSVVVNAQGRRFMDEGATSMDQLYDIVGRAVQAQDRQIAYTIFDTQTTVMDSYKAAIAKDTGEEPFASDTIEGLAVEIGVPSDTLAETVNAYNAATPDQGVDFDPLRPDGLSTQGLEPPKSNWARPISKPPYLAYPITCANVFTFGGICTDEHAQVITADDAVIPGLYAAGEVTGLYHDDYVGATSVLRALTFGRIAGRRAVRHALR